jgi:hypothetical protein
MTCSPIVVAGMPAVSESVSEMLTVEAAAPQFAPTLTLLTQYSLTKSFSRPYLLERRNEKPVSVISTQRDLLH